MARPHPWGAPEQDGAPDLAHAVTVTPGIVAGEAGPHAQTWYKIALQNCITKLQGEHFKDQMLMAHPPDKTEWQDNQ